MSADVARRTAELEAAGDDPVRRLAAMVAFDRRLFERWGDVIALLRDAGGSEPSSAPPAGHRSRSRAGGTSRSSACCFGEEVSCAGRARVLHSQHIR